MNVLSLFIEEVKTSWKQWWSVKNFKLHLLSTIILFGTVMYFSCLYLSIWEARNGIIIEDPLLNMLSPRDFSIPIFFIVHSSTIITFILLQKNPPLLLKAFQGYSIALLLRTISIYIVALEPPKGMIFLNDPITSTFLNSVHVVTKDLFFSGHISAMCVYIYFAQNNFWKRYLMFITPILAAMILWQHVHYTLDIIAAPFFTYLSCKLIEKLHEKSEFGIDNLSTRLKEIQESNL